MMVTMMVVRLLCALLWVIPTPSLALASAKFPVFYDSSNHLHQDMQYHPEQPERITACIKALQDWNDERIRLIDVTALTPQHIEGRENEHDPFSQAELDHAKNMLLQAHDVDLVLKLEERCNNSKQKRLDEGKSALGFIGYIDFDTFVTTETFDLCLRTMATWIRAVEMSESTGSPAMALTRPPGHHATASQSNGFCLYNFAAATTLHVLQDPSKRVSVLDFDVHYGQGVSDILKKHPRARYVSIHQTPAFPYLGERFSLEGEHKNVLTIPMPADTTWTCGYKDLFEKAIEFVYKPGEWEPDVVIVCAGYDALDSDELASCSLQAADYGRMSRRLLEHLESSGKQRPPLIFGLEGGYQLGEMAGGGNLQQAVIETIKPFLPV